MRRRLRSPAGRGVLAAAVVALAGAVLVGAAVAEAGDGITATGASVDKVGWWHSKNMATSTPAANVTVPPPPGVPAGTLAVGAVNGEPDRITAIGILPDAVVGDSITSFTLAIKEAGPPAAGFNGAAAKIVACPITAFWVGGDNGTWDNRPTFDCELAKAAGTRAEDGTWTFNLLPIGTAWLDPAGTIAPDGVVLVEEVDSPDGFQTVFATSGKGAISVVLDFVSGDDGTSDTTIDPSGGGDFGGGTDGGFEEPSFGSGDIPVGGLPTPDVSTPEAGTTPQDAPPSAPRSIAQVKPNILGNLPGGVLLAAPLFLVLLALLAYSLGPAGEPAAATRQRGVSRALASRSRATTFTPPASSSLETL
ncbi:MAG: hypothetical protein ACT4OV_13525 [Microthrixaceae bacterium]